MVQRRFKGSRTSFLLALSLLLGVTLACARSQQDDGAPFWSISRAGQPTPAQAASSSKNIGGLLAMRTPGGPILTPTPDTPHSLPAVRTQVEQYSVQRGDTLGQIAARFGVSVEQIAQANDLANANLLEVGQVLTIPAPELRNPGSKFKIIPTPSWSADQPASYSTSKILLKDRAATWPATMSRSATNPTAGHRSCNR
jgi:LysM repeat protein